MKVNVEEFPVLDVIAVGAHPDDAEIACGGTLAKLAQQGYQVGIIDLTDGEPTPNSPGPHVRLEEARRAAELLGVRQRVTLDLPNRRLFDSFEARIALAKEFRKCDDSTPLILITSDDGRSYSKPMLSTGYTKNHSANDLAQLDAGSASNATLTNVAGATEWFSADASDPETAGQAVDSSAIMTAPGFRAWTSSFSRLMKAIASWIQAQSMS